MRVLHEVGRRQCSTVDLELAPGAVGERLRHSIASAVGGRKQVDVYGLTEGGLHLHALGALRNGEVLVAASSAETAVLLADAYNRAQAAVKAEDSIFENRDRSTSESDGFFKPFVGTSPARTGRC